jgi:hypothetical protein
MHEFQNVEETTYGGKYQAEEAKQLDMEAFDRTSRKVGLLERSVSGSESKRSGL